MHDGTTLFPHTIDREALRAALAGPRPPVLLEALGRRYYEDGHLPGAIAFPPPELPALVASVLPDRAAPVVVYCASATCANSHQVARKLVELGYTDVRVYAGGKADWALAGLPLAT